MQEQTTGPYIHIHTIKKLDLEAHSRVGRSHSKVGRGEKSKNAYRRGTGKRIGKEAKGGRHRRRDRPYGHAAQEPEKK